MSDLLRTFLETLAAAQREGWADKLALWVFVLATLSAALMAIRGYQIALRKLEEQYRARIAELEARLKEWEDRHAWETQRLRDKLDRLQTLVLSTYGSNVPQAFLELMLEPEQARKPGAEVQGQMGPAASA